MKLKSINPSTGELLGEVKVSTQKDIESAVKAANQAKTTWGRTLLSDRTKLLRQLKKLFQKHASEIADSITQEIGTPITECEGEVNWNWSYWDWFMDNAHKALDPETTHQDKTSIHQVHYEPIGTAAVITPWNLPFDLFVWGVIPNLLVGNTVVYKASEECILTGQLIEKIMHQSSLPKGVFNAIHGNGRQGETLVDQDIDLIWFTGSTTIGHKLYQIAASKFIKAILEMGGSNPVIVFADADLDFAAKDITVKRCMFTGQTCDADKRLILEHSAAKSFLPKLAQYFGQLNIGDPLDKSVYMGPLTAKRQLNLLQAQVQDALDQGAKIYFQSQLPSNLKGAYYPPTILTHVKPSMRVWYEEVFGPVLPVMTFTIENQAIKLANDTHFGLGSQIFTSDLKKAEKLASQIQAGNVDINGIGHFIPQNPFGGYKKSGLGRAHGTHGLRELCQIKIISQPKKSS